VNGNTSEGRQVGQFAYGRGLIAGIPCANGEELFHLRHRLAQTLTRKMQYP
jgi:hypothetical protein